MLNSLRTIVSRHCLEKRIMIHYDSTKISTGYVPSSLENSVRYVFKVRLIISCGVIELRNIPLSYNLEVCNHEELTKHNRYDNCKRYLVLIYGISIHNIDDRRYLVLQFKKNNR